MPSLYTCYTTILGRKTLAHCGVVRCGLTAQVLGFRPSPHTHTPHRSSAYSPPDALQVAPSSLFPPAPGAHTPPPPYPSSPRGSPPHGLWLTPPTPARVPPHSPTHIHTRRPSAPALRTQTNRCYLPVPTIFILFRVRSLYTLFCSKAQHAQAQHVVAEGRAAHATWTVSATVGTGNINANAMHFFGEGAPTRRGPPPPQAVPPTFPPQGAPLAPHPGAPPPHPPRDGRPPPTTPPVSTPSAPPFIPVPPPPVPRHAHTPSSPPSHLPHGWTMAPAAPHGLRRQRPRTGIPRPHPPTPPHRVLDAGLALLPGHRAPGFRGKPHPRQLGYPHRQVPGLPHERAAPRFPAPHTGGWPLPHFRLCGSYLGCFPLPGAPSPHPHTHAGVPPPPHHPTPHHTPPGGRPHPTTRTPPPHGTTQAVGSWTDARTCRGYSIVVCHTPQRLHAAHATAPFYPPRYGSFLRVADHLPHWLDERCATHERCVAGHTMPAFGHSTVGRVPPPPPTLPQDGPTRLVPPQPPHPGCVPPPHPTPPARPIPGDPTFPTPTVPVVGLPHISAWLPCYASWFMQDNRTRLSTCAISTSPGTVWKGARRGRGDAATRRDVVPPDAAAPPVCARLRASPQHAPSSSPPPSSWPPPPHHPPPFGVAPTPPHPHGCPIAPPQFALRTLPVGLYPGG